MVKWRVHRAKMAWLFAIKMISFVITKLRERKERRVGKWVEEWEVVARGPSPSQQVAAEELLQKIRRL